jgi:hypothetical protein
VNADLFTNAMLQVQAELERQLWGLHFTESSTATYEQAPEVTLDDLLGMYEYIKASRPKGIPEAIIITELIIGTWEARAVGKLYYLCDEAAWLEIQQHLTEQDVKEYSVFGAMCGIPVLGTTNALGKFYWQRWKKQCQIGSRDCDCL